MIVRRFGFETLEARHLLAAQPLISEFMASNAGTLEDGDGATTDWIEIYNAGDQGVDLAGYRLTDDASDIAKWEFPNVLLNAGQYLTVFASGNGTPDSAGNLHTNFALSAGGEYLAFVSPTGTVLTEYGSNAEDYPPQNTDVSYGLAMESISIDAVTPTSSAKYLIPTDMSIDGLWTGIDFNDTNWTPGTASLGYENTPADYEDLIDTAVPTGTTTVYLRIPFTVDDPDTRLDKLRLKYDDGFIAYLNGTRVASANAPLDAGHDSVATDDHPDALALEYVDFDLRGYSDVLNVGTNVLAIHLMNRSQSSDLLAVPKLVLTSGGIIEPELIGYLASPTPGMPNTNLSASDVQFSRPAGVFSDSFQLTMTAGPGESIRYTTDGSSPDASSPLYTGSIVVDTTQQFRARTYGPVGQTGRLVSATYVKSSTAVTDFTSDLPIIVLENRGGEVPDRDFQDSTFALYDIDPTTGRSSLSNPADVTSLSAQHRRGRSTFGQPKLNLRIELRDELGNDRSQSLLGLPAESDWILYAPWTIDRAMVRHSLMYELGRQAGSWAPRTRFVEVYSNYDGGDLSANDYVGVYVLMEVIKRDAERVDIAELTPTQNSEPDVTGGYLLQIDIPEPGDVSWDSERGYPLGAAQFIPVEPEGADLTSAQSDYIRNYLDDFEDALFGPNFTDPDLGYQAYLDAEAAIDFHLMNTFSANPDAFRLSTYLTKDRGEKLAFGPLWDFDRGMGPDEDDRAADPTQWMSDQAYLWVTQYWNRLFDDPNFEQRWVDRWQELRQTVFSDSNLQATLRGQTDQLAEAQARNAARWGSGIAPNGGPLSTQGGGWAGEISHLENWLLARVAWIDTQMISQPTISPAPGDAASSTLVTLSADTGARIYYTLDGSDPRAVGGGISPNAILYNETISVTETTQINARARGTGDFFGGWSGPIEGLYSFQQPADASNLRVSELHYHPSDPTAAELAVVPTASDNDFEFIELVNVGNETLNLGGVRFVDGIDFDFGNDALVSLAAGEALVLVANEAAFVARYGDNLLVAGEYSGSLSNGGELVGLIDASGQPIQSFIYSDDPPWPTGPDGNGPSLEIVNTSGDYSSASNWRASSVSLGTPGVHSVDLPGDYDRNGIVQQADYNVWRTTFGSTIDLAADGNGDGLIDAADYTIWRDNLGSFNSNASAFGGIELSELMTETPSVLAANHVAETQPTARVYYPTQVRGRFDHSGTRLIESQNFSASDRALQEYLLIDPNDAPLNRSDDPSDCQKLTDPRPVESTATHQQALDANLAEFDSIQPW